MFEALRKRHENLGPYAQVLLIKKILDHSFSYTTPLSTTLTQIDELHRRVETMGLLNFDQLRTIWLFHALGKEFGHLQSAIQTLSENPNFTSKDVQRRLEAEEAQIQRRVEQGLDPRPSEFHVSAFPAIDARRPREPKPPCANCKRTNHSTDFCIAPGGKMFGKTIEEAINSQRAATRSNRPPRTQQYNSNTTQVAHVASQPQANFPSPSPSVPASTHSNSAPAMMINGLQYIPNPNWSAYISEDPSLPPQHVNVASTNYEYCALLASCNKFKTSVDWNTQTYPVDLLQLPSEPFAFPAGRTPALNTDDKPFILDSGASCHITPERSDFRTFSPIPPLPVSGLEGSSVYAIGTGTVDLHIASGHKLSLTNVLYIPSSKVRLISSLALGDSEDFTSHFSKTECWITNKSNAVVARGTVSRSRNLYIIPHFSPLVYHSCSAPPNTALHAARTPDIETWHRRLGHCSTHTVVDMAKSSAVQGMPVDISSLPPKCDHCILGKQTRASVPKVREGVRAVRPLEHVFLDLCGPMSVPSRSGRLYSMNVIDDFSSYVWSLPLRNKSEALPVFQAWHKTVENQSNHRLATLVTDNGELTSNAMTQYCSEHGITHLFTAPYTSAQNGRAERLHRTLLTKARTMRSACEAPPNMWDEFCATAAYLTNLTITSSLNGKTPFELWYE
jgi:transposase InsO family protein